MPSRSFGDTKPYNPHTARRPSQGVPGSVFDLRADVESAFQAIEAEIDGLDARITALEGGGGGGGVVSVFGRAGVVTAAPGDYGANQVDFTPDGDISSTDVQSAIEEVRDDADIKLSSKVQIGGQLGGTISSPDVRGLRETGGPTLLTLGAVPDGLFLARAGTSIIGVPGGGAATYRGIIGWSGSNYLERAAGSALDGNAVTGFEILAAVLERGDGWYLGAGGHIVSHRDEGGSTGYALGVGGTRPEPGVSDGAGSDFGIFNFQNWMPDQPYRLAFYSVGTDLVDKRFTLNGLVISASLGTGGYTDSGLPTRVGRSAGSGAAAYTGVVLGLAWKTTGLYTNDELRVLMEEFLRTGDFGTSIPAHVFGTSGLSVGAMPATWSDGVGGLDLTLVGSLSIVDVPVLGGVLTHPIPVSNFVTRNGGLLDPGSQAVSGAGPTTIAASNVLANTSGGVVGLTTPSFPTVGVEITVWDVGGAAGGSTITINAAGGQTINGLSSIDITVNWGAVRMVFDGTSNWTAVRMSP